MRSFGFFLLLFSFVALVLVSCSKKNGIDWETEAIREYNRFELDFGAHRMDELVQDVFAEGFVFITPNFGQIIKGDFEAMEKYVAASSKRGYWRPGPPRLISTCYNTALMWSAVLFKDKQNKTQTGYETFLYEYMDNQAKMKMLQFQLLMWDK